MGFLGSWFKARSVAGFKIDGDWVKIWVDLPPVKVKVKMFANQNWRLEQLRV